MSTFEVLKYGGIDFTCEEEVRKLPYWVIQSIWAQIYNNIPNLNDEPDFDPFEFLAGVTSKTRPVELKNALMNALRNYNEPV